MSLIITGKTAEPQQTYRIDGQCVGCGAPIITGCYGDEDGVKYDKECIGCGAKMDEEAA